MGSADDLREMLRERAWRDDPTSVLACADLAAWERAEGLASEAAADAIRRKDVERFIPGLPARRTFMVLGWVVLAAFILDNASDWLPPADWVDALDMALQYGTACGGVAVAGWSILSEVRGWEGSDAATWFLKARFDRYQKRLEARARTMRDTLIALKEERLVVYRVKDGTITREAFAPDAVVDLSLERGASHMALRLATRAGGWRFEWLRRDAAFEAAVEGFVGAMRRDVATAAAAISLDHSV